MTIQELDNKYYFHDSMITNISYSPDTETLVVLMEFCNWAQDGYTDDEPELLVLKLTFEGISDYNGITGDINYFSILDGDIVDDKYHLLIEDDFNQAFYEYYLDPTNIQVEIVGVAED